MRVRATIGVLPAGPGAISGKPHILPASPPVPPAGFAGLHRKFGRRSHSEVPGTCRDTARSSTSDDRSAPGRRHCRSRAGMNRTRRSWRPSPQQQGRFRLKDTARIMPPSPAQKKNRPGEQSSNRTGFRGAVMNLCERYDIGRTKANPKREKREENLGRRLGHWPTLDAGGILPLVRVRTQFRDLAG